MICSLTCKQMSNRDDDYGSVRSRTATSVDHCRETSDRGGESGAWGQCKQTSWQVSKPADRRANKLATLCAAPRAPSRSWRGAPRPRHLCSRADRVPTRNSQCRNLRVGYRPDDGKIHCDPKDPDMFEPPRGAMWNETGLPAWRTVGKLSS